MGLRHGRARPIATLLVALISGDCAGNPNNPGPEGVGFVPYPLEGGYPPGTLISLGEKNLVTGQLVPVARFMANLKDQHVLDRDAPAPLPGTTFNRTKEFKLSLNASSDVQHLDDSAKATIDKVKTVELDVIGGQRLLLKAGGIALEDVLAALPCEDLKKIERALSNKAKARFVTEAQEYSSGKATFKFKSDVAISLQATIVNVLRIGGTPQWTDNSTLTLSYSSPILVGYKAREVSSAMIHEYSTSTCNKRAPRDSRSVANLHFSFNTTDSSKDSDTRVSGSIYRLADGIVVASTEYTRNDVWPDQTTRDFDVPLTPAIPVKDLGQYGVRVCIQPIGNDTWRFIYTVSGNYPAVPGLPGGTYSLKDPQLQTLTEASRCIQSAL